MSADARHRDHGQRPAPPSTGPGVRGGIARPGRTRGAVAIEDDEDRSRRSAAGAVPVTRARCRVPRVACMGMGRSGRHRVPRQPRRPLARPARARTPERSMRAATGEGAQVGPSAGRSPGARPAGRLRSARSVRRSRAPARIAGGRARTSRRRRGRPGCLDLGGTGNVVRTREPASTAPAVRRTRCRRHRRTGRTTPRSR